MSGLANTGVMNPLREILASAGAHSPQGSPFSESRKEKRYRDMPGGLTTWLA